MVRSDGDDTCLPEEAGNRRVHRSHHVERSRPLRMRTPATGDRSLNASGSPVNGPCSPAFSTASATAALGPGGIVGQLDEGAELLAVPIDALEEVLGQLGGAEPAGPQRIALSRAVRS